MNLPSFLHRSDRTRINWRCFLRHFDRNRGIIEANDDGFDDDDDTDDD